MDGQIDWLEGKNWISRRQLGLEKIGENHKMVILAKTILFRPCGIESINAVQYTLAKQWSNLMCF